MSPGPTVAAVTVTYNSAAVLPGFLDTLADGFAGLDGWRLVVADNASTDATLDVLGGRAPEATVVRSSHNAGFAAGVNAAVAAAGPSPAYLVVNPDTRLGRACVRRLQAALDAPGTGIAVPRLLDGQGHLSHSLRRWPTVRRALCEAFLGGRLAGRCGLGEVVTEAAAYAAPRTADWATGAVMLVSAACMAAVGPLDESFFLYSEETDFAMRARDAGFALRYVPDAVAVHLGGGAHDSPRLWSLLVVNKVRLFGRHHGRLHTAAFWAGVTAGEGVRALAGRATSRAAVRALLRRPTRPGPAR